MVQSTKFLIICMIFAVKVSYGQQPKLLNSIKFSTVLRYNDFPIRINSFPILIIKGNFYASQLGFVCKKENLLEKFSGIPFRFRLGSQAYNNRMEGKSVPLTLD